MPDFHRDIQEGAFIETEHPVVGEVGKVVDLDSIKVLSLFVTGCDDFIGYGFGAVLSFAQVLRCPHMLVVADTDNKVGNKAHCECYSFM